MSENQGDKLMADVGGALLRVIGEANRQPDEENTATYRDAIVIIDAVLGSAEFRARCSVFSNLSSDVSLPARKELCRAILILMQARRKPKEDPPKRGGDRDITSFRTTTPEFCGLAAYCAIAAPWPHKNWSDHVEANYNGKSVTPQSARISPYFAEICQAFEELFGVPGTILEQS